MRVKIAKFSLGWSPQISPPSTWFSKQLLIHQCFGLLKFFPICNYIFPIRDRPCLCQTKIPQCSKKIYNKSYSCSIQQVRAQQLAYVAYVCIPTFIGIHMILDTGSWHIHSFFPLIFYSLQNFSIFHTNYLINTSPYLRCQ